MITIIGGLIGYLVMVFIIGIDIPVTIKFMIIIFIINITTTTAALITTIQMAAPQPIFVINIITITTLIILTTNTTQMAAPQPMVKPDFFGVKKDMNGVITVYLPQVQYWMIILIAIVISKMVILR